MRALWTAGTGMGAQQANIDVISNNLANVNTTGYKKSRADFQDLMYQKPRSSGAESSGGNIIPTGIEIGNGSRVGATSKEFTQGQLTQSGEKHAYSHFDKRL